MINLEQVRLLEVTEDGRTSSEVLKSLIGTRGLEIDSHIESLVENDTYVPRAGIVHRIAILAALSAYQQPQVEIVKQARYVRYDSFPVVAGLILMERHSLEELGYESLFLHHHMTLVRRLHGEKEVPRWIRVGRSERGTFASAGILRSRRLADRSMRFAFLAPPEA